MKKIWIFFDNVSKIGLKSNSFQMHCYVTLFSIILLAVLLHTLSLPEVCTHFKNILHFSKFSFCTYAGFKIHFVYKRIWNCNHLRNE